ncbi:hypothetical protein Dimus_000251 [Dionaea muscipula]
MAAHPHHGVRIVAKIRASVNPEPGSTKWDRNPWISVNRPEDNPSSRVRISFGDQPNGGKQLSYEVDECYGGDSGNDVVFEKEIQPLISGVFEGRSATVFAYGAKGSGKTFTIQGTEDAAGVAAMSVGEILTQAKARGIMVSVSISLFEICQERIIDLLDSKRPEVSVLEDAQGKIKLKGLSKVNVKSMPEFMKFFRGANVGKPLQKVANKTCQHPHRGLIVHVLSSINEMPAGLVVGKMNFLDLAGYEDPRKKGSNGTNHLEIVRINNKSLYAIQNVVHALKSGEIHVPYRESKLTRMLQDSLGRRNKIVMVTCMNPSFCEDTIKALSSASRSCLVGHPANADLVLRGKSATKSLKHLASSVSAKKQAASLLCVSMGKATDLAKEEKGRRLFVEDNKLDNSEQCLSTTECSLQEKETCVSFVADIQSEYQPSQTVAIKKEYSAPKAISEVELFKLVQAEVANISDLEDDHVMPTPVGHQTPKAADFPIKDQENRSSLFDEGGGSLPVSARLRQLSNNLKSLCTTSSSTRFKLPTTQEDESLTDHDEARHEISLFRTPSAEMGPIDFASTEEKSRYCSTGVKDSFVQTHLNFMNTANKNELMKLKGIGEKRASYIVELRGRSPQPFKNLTDLQNIGLSSKQIKLMMREAAGDLF